MNDQPQPAASTCGSCSTSPTALPVACDLGVFTPVEREAHAADTLALMKQVREARGLDDGWELHFDVSLLADVSRWFLDERRCCPFLSLGVDLASSADTVAVRLRGPDGTKEVLRSVAEEMGVRLG